MDMVWLWEIIKFEFSFKPQTKAVRVRLLNLKVYSKRLKPSITAVKEPSKKKKARIKKPVEKKAEREKRRFSVRDFLEEVQSTASRFSIEAVYEILHLLIRLLRSLQIKVEGEAEVGLKDPADTGMLLGLFHAVVGISRLGSFCLMPNWDQPTLQARVRFDARLWLAQIVLTILRTLLAKPVRKIWWPYAKRALNPFTRIRAQTA